MRSTTISVVVIVVALAAIVAGFINGQNTAPRPMIVQLHPRPAPSVQAVFHDASDFAMNDEFSDDDVVVERDAVRSDAWLPQRLAFVVGLVGRSAPIDSTFLRLGLPIAFDLDPRAPDAVKVARLIHSQGNLLLLHVDDAVTTGKLADLRAQFGVVDGIASRESRGQAEALAGTGLMFFDERGDADRMPFTAHRVRFIARDTTVDNRSARTYIAYMLNRAAMRSARQGRLVVLMRPQPNSLAVLDTFARTRSAQIVALTASR